MGVQVCDQGRRYGMPDVRRAVQGHGSRRPVGIGLFERIVPPGKTVADRLGPEPAQRLHQLGDMVEPDVPMRLISG